MLKVSNIPSVSSSLSYQLAKSTQSSDSAVELAEFLSELTSADSRVVLQSDTLQTLLHELAEAISSQVPISNNYTQMDMTGLLRLTVIQSNLHISNNTIRNLSKSCEFFRIRNEALWCLSLAIIHNYIPQGSLIPEIIDSLKEATRENQASIIAIAQQALQKFF